MLTVKRAINKNHQSESVCTKNWIIQKRSETIHFLALAWGIRILNGDDNIDLPYDILPVRNFMILCKGTLINASVAFFLWRDIRRSDSVDGSDNAEPWITNHVISTNGHSSIVVGGSSTLYQHILPALFSELKFNQILFNKIWTNNETKYWLWNLKLSLILAT